MRPTRHNVTVLTWVCLTLAAAPPTVLVAPEAIGTALIRTRGRLVFVDGGDRFSTFDVTTGEMLGFKDYGDRPALTYPKAVIDDEWWFMTVREVVVARRPGWSIMRRLEVAELLSDPDEEGLLNAELSVARSNHIDALVIARPTWTVTSTRRRDFVMGHDGPRPPTERRFRSELILLRREARDLTRFRLAPTVMPPTIVAGPKTIVVRQDDTLTALDPDGRRRWSRAARGLVAIVDDLLVEAGARLYLSRAGTDQPWGAIDLPRRATALGVDDDLAVISDDRALWAYDLDRQRLRWRVPIEHALSTTLRFGLRVLAVQNGREVLAIDRTTGAVVRRQPFLHGGTAGIVSTLAGDALIVSRPSRKGPLIIDVIRLSSPPR